MTLSVRFDEELEQRLRQIAKMEGVSVSEVIRRAANMYWLRHTSSSLELRLADVLGKVESSGGRARQTGRAYRKALGRTK